MMMTVSATVMPMRNTGLRYKALSVSDLVDLVGWLLLELEDFMAAEEPVFDLLGFCF
jgi:hypothetical protein